MAPIKFEEHLREKLEKRTIQPSTEAWDVLENRLNHQDKKQNQRTYWWLGIAASIVGIILVTTLVFEKSESKTIIPVIVDAPNKTDVNENTVAIEDVEPLAKETIDNPKPESKSADKVKPKAEIKKAIPNFNSVSEALKETVASNGVKEEGQVQKTDKIPVNSVDFEKAKLNDVVAEINKLKAENHEVSEAEIDSLLKRAERDILTHRIYNENIKTVDANALLQDVEADLEQSFRSRVFEALKSSYETVITAVAERNN
ncbi:hypothetical protein ACS386_00265 [Flavobacteriaceae bacterium LMO-SS05]